MDDPRPEAVVRAQFAAVNRQEWAQAMAAFAEDVVLVVPGDFLTGGRYEGRERVGRWFADWMRTFSGRIHFEIRGAREASEDLAFWAHHIARGHHSGIELESDVFYHYRGRGGQIVFAEFCPSWEDALRAAGLES